MARAEIEFHVRNGITSNFMGGGLSTAAPQTRARPDFRVTDAVAFARNHLALHCKNEISP